MSLFLPGVEEEEDTTCIVERIAPRFGVETGNKGTEEDTEFPFSFLLLLLGIWILGKMVNFSLSILLLRINVVGLRFIEEDRKGESIVPTGEAVFKGFEGEDRGVFNELDLDFSAVCVFGTTKRF